MNDLECEKNIDQYLEVQINENEFSKSIIYDEDKKYILQESIPLETEDPKLRLRLDIYEEIQENESDIETISNKSASYLNEIEGESLDFGMLLKTQFNSSSEDDSGLECEEIRPIAVNKNALTSEERKQKRREQNRKWRENMTEDQKQKLREKLKKQRENRTEDQKQMLREKRKIQRAEKKKQIQKENKTGVEVTQRTKSNPMTAEEKIIKRREYYRRKRESMTEEQKKENREKQRVYKRNLALKRKLQREMEQARLDATISMNS